MFLVWVITQFIYIYASANYLFTLVFVISAYPWLCPWYILFLVPCSFVFPLRGSIKIIYFLFSCISAAY